MGTEGHDELIRLIDAAVTNLTKMQQDVIARLILLEEEVAAHKKLGSECPHTAPAAGGEADELGNY